MAEEVEEPNVDVPEFEEEESEEVGSEEGKLAEPEAKEEEIPEEKETPEEDEKTRVQKRIDALTWEREETKRKLNLLKTDPDKYYEAYPEERPQGYRPEKSVQEEGDLEDYESMIIQGGPHDGMTLGELAGVKPLTAQKMLNDYLDQQRQAQREVQERENLSKRAWENEVNRFGESLCKEIYQRPYTELTQEEIDKVNDLIYQVDQWKKANGRAHYSYGDAYALMHSKDLLNSAREKAAKKTVEALKKSPVGSVSGRTEVSKSSIDYSGMNEDQLGEHVSSLSDAEAEKFYREAPQSLKNKYPSWPWE